MRSPRSTPLRATRVPPAASTNPRATWLVHNAVLASVTLLLFFAFLETRADWDPMHAQNRALADASFVLLVGTLAVGPLARLWSPASRLIPWRREMGNWSVYAAVGHLWIVFSGWAELELFRLFYTFNLFKRDWALDQGFALANLLGLLALVYGAVLLATSNELSVRLLGGSSWKFLQQGIYVLYMLVVLHTAYFLFFHFVSFHRPMPPPNWAQGPFLVLVALLAVLQTAGFVATVRRRRRDGARERAQAAPHPTEQPTFKSPRRARRHAVG